MREFTQKSTWSHFEGIQKGEQNRDKELVLHMLSLGESMERIAALLGRSLEDIKKLQAEALA